jgi:hypothetical protein
MQTGINEGSPPAAAPSGPAAPAGNKGAGREAYVAAMAARKGGDEAPAEKAAPPPDPVEVAPPDVAADAVEPDAGDAPPPAEAKDAVRLDPAAEKRMAVAQKEEQRRKAAIAKERAEAQAAADKRQADLDKREAEIAARAKALEDFDRLRERARYEPDAVLQNLGLAPDDLVAAASKLMLHDPKYANDPKAKEAVARMMRERESRTAVEKTGGKVAELEAKLEATLKKLEERDSHQQGEAVVSAFLDDIEDSLGDDHPITARALTAARAKASDRSIPVAERREAQQSHKAIRDEFRAVATELYRRDNVEPEPHEVAAEVEARRVAELRKWGVDPAALAQQPAAAPKKPAAPPPRVLARGNASPTQPPRKLTPEEQRAEFVRLRAAGKIGEG